jgi:nitroreductase
MPDFFDVVLRQRACRAFRPDPLDDDIVERVLQAATFAPSAENRQPWVFVVVRDPDRRAAIGDLNRRAWEGGAKKHSEARLTPSLLDQVDRGAQGGVAGAPVLVVVGGDTRLGDRRVLAASIFPATQNMLLAAGALGLGAALTTLPLVFGDELAAIVGFPPEVQPMAVVPLGWPTRPLGPPTRLPVADKAHRDTFGSPW